MNFNYYMTSEREDTLFIMGLDRRPRWETPEAAMTVVTDLLYGTTRPGGAANAGTIFSVNPIRGAEHVLHSFGVAATDGTLPEAPLVDVAGTLYSTTTGGGT